MAEGEDTSAPKQKQEARKRTLWSKIWDRTGLRGKTLWDWLELLLVPFILGTLGLFWTTAQEDARQQYLEDLRAQDAALQAYLEQMSAVLLRENSLREPGADNDEVRALARARTLMILRTVDELHKTEVISFLLEADLVQATDGRPPAISLSGADLEGVNLSETDLSNVQLDNTDLRYANLMDANLMDADLMDANLNGANLRNVHGITSAELEQTARSLKGATMPNGQKYEDWLKDKEGRKEDEKGE
jgi:hypothetical protein